mmetsp:Transcript_6823/g.11917  ORF Transcript_6823/g.11917 Transcript_6823/m.11917 type:complete len:164 (-) Transcript_6823:61-552(-)
MTTLKKFFSYNSKPTAETFPELPDAVVWFRFVLAILYGSYLGLAQVRGGTNVIFATNIILFLPTLYCQLILAADTDSYPSLNFVGVVHAVALMLLIWIYFYSMSFADEEAKLAAAASTIMAMAGGTGGDGVVGEAGNVDVMASDATAESVPVEPTLPVEETEF